MKFNLVAVAGTFDHLHLGHKKLLETAKNSGRKFIVGLCRQSMLSDKTFPQSLESYSQRHRSVAKLKPNRILPLADIYGPAVKSHEIEAIVCSSLSRPNVETINRQRKNPLAIIEAPVIKCSDSQILSSSRIRQGLVNRQGYFYPQIFRHRLTLPKSLRLQLQRPLAPVIKKIVKLKFNTISVGDIATISLLKQKITPQLAIVDLKTKRQQVFSSLSALGLKTGIKASNPAGMITQNSARQILNCLTRSCSTLLIDGEEDLMVLPAILLAPLNTVVYYGQPNQGVVKIIVTESAKAKARRLIEQFTMK